MPISRRAGGSRVMSVPSTLTVPASGFSKPATTFSSVVLPEPLGPRIVSSSPEAMSSDTPSSATTSPKRLTRPSISRSADRDATHQPFLSFQAFHSSSALLPFSAYQESSIQNCLSMYCVGRYGFTLASTKFSASRFSPG